MNVASPPGLSPNNDSPLRVHRSSKQVIALHHVVGLSPTWAGPHSSVWFQGTTAVHPRTRPPVPQLGFSVPPTSSSSLLVLTPSSSHPRPRTLIRRRTLVLRHHPRPAISIPRPRRALVLVPPTSRWAVSLPSWRSSPPTPSHFFPSCSALPTLPLLPVVLRSPHAPTSSHRAPLRPHDPPTLTNIFRRMGPSKNSSKNVPRSVNTCLASDRPRALVRT